MASSDNKSTITAFLEEVLNQGRLDRADDLVLEDFVELDPLPGQGPGRAGLKDTIRQLLTAFPDMHWVAEEMIAEGDKVVTRFTWTGTHRAPFLGIPGTNRNVAVKGVVIDHLQGGRMAESRILMDTLSLLQQLGAVPPPAA